MKPCSASPLLLHSLLCLSVAADVSTKSCPQACANLSTLLPLESIPSTYWAQQQSALKAACYIRPTSSKAVSKALLVAKNAQCPFAIRGSGHSDVPGASNINGGITIDLSALQQTTIAPGNTVTRVGAGRNWGDVYTFLDTFNLTVVGGRESSVGVAGLTLGGGVSYFSGLYGFACDNVINYEVVLADGTIAQVNSSGPYSDIYRALRGGGNNFGIVTHFDLATYPYHLMYGGLSIYRDDANTTTGLIDAYGSFTMNAPSDPYGALFLSLDYTGGSFIWAAGLEYAKADLNPKIFAPFKTPELTAAMEVSTERIATHSNLATELGATEPSGYRNQFTTKTYKFNKELMYQMTQIYRDEVAKAVAQGLSADPSLVATIAFQPITSNELVQQAKRGGNVLGLDVSEAPLMLMNFNWQWSMAQYDTIVITAISNIVKRSTALAKSMNLYNEYVYMNYAAPGQQPVASYGAANRAFMKQVQAKYDPSGVFTKLVPGGFKVV